MFTDAGIRIPKEEIYQLFNENPKSGKRKLTFTEFEESMLSKRSNDLFRSLIKDIRTKVHNLDFKDSAPTDILYLPTDLYIMLSHLY